MTWPWQRLRSSDELIPCTCGSTLPALPQAPLANMVRRGTSIVRIQTGTMYRCIACQRLFHVATQGPHKGLIKLQREPEAQPLGMTQAEANEYAKELKKRAASRPVYARDEMKEPL